MGVKSDLKFAEDLDRSSMQQLGESEQLLSYVHGAGNTGLLAQAATRITHSAEEILWSSIYKTSALATEIADVAHNASRAAVAIRQDLDRVRFTRLPQVHNYAATRVDVAVRVVSKFATSQAVQKSQQVKNQLLGDLQILRTQIDARLSKLQQQLQAGIQQAEQQAAQEFQQAQARADQQFRQAEADAQALAKQAQQQATRVAQQNADRQASAPWRTQWAEITAGVTAVLTQLAGDHPDLARQLRVIVAAEPATLTEAEAAAAAAVPPMLTALQECVIPDCQDLSQLRASLHDLADIAMFAALLAWLVQMVTDPRRWAEETYAVLGPVVDAELSAVKAVLGL